VMGSLIDDELSDDGKAFAMGHDFDAHIKS
jgi:hypothetical protein